MTRTAPDPIGSHVDQFELLVGAVTGYAIYMVDDQGFIRSWNKGAERLKGYTPQEIIGQHYSVFFSAEDKRAGVPLRNLEDAKHSAIEWEGWRVRKDGSLFWASAALHPIRDEAGHLIGYAKITRDLTDQKKTLDALRQSEESFRLLVEGVTDYAIFMLDLNGIISKWNKGAERLKGYSAEEIIGEHFSIFYEKEDRAKGLPARALEKAAQEGRYEVEGWRLRKDGSRFWAAVVMDAIRNEKGDIVGFAKLTRDITERRAAQDALLESERQFRLLVKGVTDYALFMLDPNGIVTSWNAGAERIKGYTADEIIGKHFSKFYTEPDRSQDLPLRALHTALEQGRFESEGWRVRKDGSHFWANAVIDAIRDEQGDLIGFAKITRDITEKRNARLALEKVQAQRDQAKRLEAIGQLTGGVAHDFNNLLMIVSGHLRALKAQAGDNPKALRAASAIETAVQRGAGLTRQMLTFARRQSLVPTVIDLREQVSLIEDMLTSAIGEASKLLSRVPEDTWSVKVDLGEFELAMVNLVFNARDAIGTSGTITITAENVSNSADMPGEFVAITVADTGCGIAPDILPKVFDPFFTTKQAEAKGSGLGLSQVHGFAHQSGGTVKIASEVGKGTQVTMFLPRHRGEVEQAVRSQVEESSAGGLVLLVEDNPDVLAVSVDSLEELGYEVLTAADAQGALKVVENRKVSLVVSDIVMAGELNGVQLARRLREHNQELPILLVTGFSENASSAESEFVVLRKPFQLVDLSRAIAKAISNVSPPKNLINLQDARRDRIS